MKKILFFLTVFVTVIGLHSCSNADEPKPTQGGNLPDVTVASLADFVPSSRSTDGGTGKVLCFKDEATFETTVAHLQKMDADSKAKYFAEIGFEGAYILQTKADEELEALFDADTDSIQFCKQIQTYISKYEGIFDFHVEDKMDVTPNLKFDDEKAALVGNVDGWVVIGNEVKRPQARNLAAAPGPMVIGFHQFKGADIKLKNGKYQSHFRLGRDGVNLAFKTETFRQKFLHKKYDNGCGHNAIVDITSGNKKFHEVIHTKSGVWRFYALAADFSPRLNLKLTDFWCTRDPNHKQDNTVNNILVN